MKVHYMKTKDGMNRTSCGILAARSPLTDSEADTVSGGRIDVTKNDREVTCNRCRKLRYLGPK